MTDNDDDSIGFDLAAWEAPRAPDVADAVLARMREPARAAAAVEPEPTRHVPWWIGGVAAAAIAGIVVLAQRESAEPLTGSGAVATARPSRIDLGNTSSAALDGATDVHWVRDDHRLVALQPRGTATWQVAADDTLVIDAGATVASVRASGASLRVEVEMQFTGTHMIGASAATGVVAAVTVIVFQGQVEVAGNGRTVAVAAGETVTLRPGKPPVVPPEPPIVAGVPDDPRRAEMLRLEREIKRLEAEQKRLLAQHATALDADDPSIAKQVDMLQRVLPACDRTRTITVVLAIDPDGTAHPKEVTPITALACVSTAVGGLKFPAGGFRETAFDVVQRPTPPPPVTVQPTPLTGCGDVSTVRQVESQGDQLLQQGNYAGALGKFEQILKCKPTLLIKTYLAACNSKEFVRAKAHFRLIPAGKRDYFAQVCMKNGFDPREP